MIYKDDRCYSKWLPQTENGMDPGKLLPNFLVAGDIVFPRACAVTKKNIQINLCTTNTETLFYMYITDAKIITDKNVLIPFYIEWVR